MTSRKPLCHALLVGPAGLPEVIQCDHSTCRKPLLRVVLRLIPHRPGLTVRMLYSSNE
jgi:hypothetical protein